MGAVLSCGTCLCLGICFLRMLRIRTERAESCALGFVIGSACLSQLILFLCAFGIAYRSVFIAIGLLGSAALAAQRRTTEKHRHGSSLPSVPGPWKWLLGVPFALFGTVYLVNALAPEMSPDGSSYHLP